MDDRAAARRHILLLAALCGLCFFWRLGSYGLFDLDEGLYVAAAREMHLSGDYVTPRVNGEPFFEKPPLIYWSAALMFRLFGVNELAARLPAALATTLLVFLIYAFGSRVFGARSGLLSATFFALSPLVLGEARQLTTDAMLDLWIAAALFSYFLAYSSESTAGKRWYYGFWAACGLGVLTKGVVGLLLPCAIAFVFVLFAERFQLRAVLSRIGEARLPTGIVLFLLIVLPWHDAAYRASGDAFWHEYIVRQHLRRFRGGDTSHHAPFWFYVPTFLLGFFPWSVFSLPALLERTPTGASERADLARILLKVWAVFIFLFFTISGSKLVSYILPMFAAVALLTGDWCARAIDRRDSRRTLISGAAVAFALSTLLLTIVLLREPIIHAIEASTHRAIPTDQVPDSLMAWAEHLLVIVTLTTAAGLALFLMNRRRDAFAALAIGMTLFIAVSVSEGLSAIDLAFSAPLRIVAEAARHESRDGVPVVLNIGPPRRPSVLFYLDDRGGAHDPNGVRYAYEMNDPKEVIAFLETRRQALVLTDRKREGFYTNDPAFRILMHSGPWTLLRVDTTITANP